MPIDYKTYPDNWKELRRERLLKAHHLCELCHAPDSCMIARDKFGQWHNPVLATEKRIRVVLTIHHLNNDKTDNRQANLIALCQRCHLKLHAGDRGKKERRKK